MALSGLDIGQAKRKIDTLLLLDFVMQNGEPKDWECFQGLIHLTLGFLDNTSGRLNRGHLILAFNLNAVVVNCAALVSTCRCLRVSNPGKK